jgi:hypothetical protein
MKGTTKPAPSVNHLYNQPYYRAKVVLCRRRAPKHHHSDDVIRRIAPIKQLRLAEFRPGAEVVTQVWPPIET